MNYGVWWRSLELMIMYDDGGDMGPHARTMEANPPTTLEIIDERPAPCIIHKIVTKVAPTTCEAKF